MPIRPSSPAFLITSVGKRLSRSISSAIGRTSPSAKSRARRWISRCSSESSNIGGGAYPRRHTRPELVLLRQLLGPSEPVEQLVVEGRPLVLRRPSLRRGGKLGRRHLAGDGRVTGALLLQLGAHLVELALPGCEQVTQVLLDGRFGFVFGCREQGLELADAVGVP